MKIPNCERALVDIRKLTEYILNPNHLRGRHKARVFASALGLTAHDAELLQDALLKAACNDSAVQGSGDEYGQRYTVDFTMIGDEGQEAIVRSSWIIMRDEDFPRLTTCYVR